MTKNSGILQNLQGSWLVRCFSVSRRLRRIVRAMRLVKWTAVIVTFALVLQTGCDLWCHQAAEIASASQGQSTATPPCHDASHNQNSQNKQHSGGKHEMPVGCLHPQVTDDSSKLGAKAAVVVLPAATVAVPSVHDNLREQTLRFIAFTPIGLSSSARPLFFLRI